MNLIPWTSVYRVSGIIIIAILTGLLLHLFLRRVEKRITSSSISHDRGKRLTTLIKAGNSIGYVLIVLVFSLMILYELGINIAPVLASAGVVGLAFSLGSQTIIKDYLAGIIILSENQFTIDDVITVGQFTGTVENITLRATHLRDVEGKLVIIPNGDIRSVSNLTTKWAQVVITFNFDYDVDMEKVVQSLEETIKIIQKKKDLSTAFIGTASAYGWTGFTDWAIQAQIIAKTRPGKQWLAGRELRRQALITLGEKGIHPAIPRERYEAIS